MFYLNKTYIIGNLCKEPNLRKTPYGKDICDLLIAVDRKSTNVDFLPVIAFNDNAIKSSKFKVGDILLINGRVQSRNYEKQDGTRHVAIEIVAFEIYSLENKNDYSLTEILQAFENLNMIFEKFIFQSEKSQAS